ncbi:MAG: peptidylprolyl isomerase [Verrucomicrobium sp.]|nr:peptidylprolyl isomerase [Verrucomicrobium sp.]
MKLSFRCLFLATFLALPAVHAQDPAYSPAPAPASEKPTTGPLKPIKASDVKKDLPAAVDSKVNETHTLAVMKVTFGGEDRQIVFELFPNESPVTVQNFTENVNKGAYNGMAFHRSVDDYLVQTGDPASKDNNNRDQWGLGEEYTIPGEFKLPHTIGSVAMARRSDKVNPNRKSNGTQFYFAVGDMSSLNGQYSVFGKVVVGMDDLKELSRVATDSNDCPLERVEIKSIKVVEQKGPVVAMATSSAKKGKKGTKPESLKGPFEKFLERVW